MTIESQKVTNSHRNATPKESIAVMELEVMKFVAYCGGLTIRVKVEEIPSGPVDTITWGLATLRPCPALNNERTQTFGCTGVASPRSSGGGARAAATCGGTNAAKAKIYGDPTQSVPLDNSSRKQLYPIACTVGAQAPRRGDIMSLVLTPREDGQPVIMVTLSLNDAVVHTVNLPCSAIAPLQMYPFVTVHGGVTVALQEALTPSPLFTWFSPTQSTADIQMADLDTCVKYNAPNGATTTPGGISEFHGSTSFSGGRHRWTIQLDNMGTQPGWIYVGLVNVEPCTAVSTANLSASLSSLPAGMRSMGAANVPTSPAGAGPSTSVFGPPSPMDIAPAAAPPPRGKWGVWVKLPVASSLQNLPSAQHVPPSPIIEGQAHVMESQSSHCCITCDLDLIHSTARFFRNGHPIGTPFSGLVRPISPALGFQQAASQHLQAGLVNITKLRQLNMEWNTEACSGDLRITGRGISKISEVFGDYSTVLANTGFISGVHLWLIKVNNLAEPDSIFVGVCRGCMPLDQDPQDLRDRTYYLSNGVIRVGGRRVATNAANFTRGDTVGVVLDADQGEIVFLRNGIEQGRARGIRGRLYPFVSFDSENDHVTLLGSYSLNLNRTPRQLADMEWDTLGHAADIELSSNCLTATKSSPNGHSTVRGTILYTGLGCHEFHVILDSLGPDGVWVGVAPPNLDTSRCVGDVAAGWALHSDGDKRHDGREEEFTVGFKNGDVLSVCLDLGKQQLRFARNGVPLGTAFTGLRGPLVACITLASEESKITIQNRPTVLNTGEYTGELRWDEVRAGKDLHVIDGLTVTKMANDGGDYATVLGTLSLSSSKHSWNIYINHVEDSNLFIGCTVGGHDLNADPQEMKHRTYYLSNGTIRVAGKLVTRCAEPYAEGDLVTVQLDMESKAVNFLKNGVLQGSGDGLPEEVWPYVSLDNIMDSITLHSSHMFADLAQSLKWNPGKCSRFISLQAEGATAALRAEGQTNPFLGQATVLGVREYVRQEVHSWKIRLEQPVGSAPANFLVGVAPPNMDPNHSIGEERCGIGLDYFGYIYVNGRYFHASHMNNWQSVAKPVRGSTARHKGKAEPWMQFIDGVCEITLTLDLKDNTLKFSSGGHSIGTLASKDVRGPLLAAITMTSNKQTATLAPGPIGKSEHTAEELVHILKAKGSLRTPRVESAMLVIPREVFVPRDRHREAFRDQKVTIRMTDGSTLTMPPPAFIATALEKLDVRPGACFLDVGCGSGYVTALAACLVGSTGVVHGIECLSSRLESARGAMRALRQRLPVNPVGPIALLGDVSKAVGAIDLQLSNVLIPECTEGILYDAVYCDNSLSEEDLPSFLALLKPNGKMTVVIEEELLCISRTGQSPHDYHRESVLKLVGEFGVLEDPTPWEVQEAIQRIKNREKQKGLQQAKSDMASIKNHEFAEMQSRVSTAMQRVADLEATLAQIQRANPSNPVARAGSPMVVRVSSPLARAGTPGSCDDVRATIRDNKSRKTPRLSPHGNKSPVAGATAAVAMAAAAAAAAGNDADWRGYGAAANADSVKQRVRHLLGDEEELVQAMEESKISAAYSGYDQTPPQQMLIFEELLHEAGVQHLTPGQIRVLAAGAPITKLGAYTVRSANLAGTAVRLWQLTIDTAVNAVELLRYYSRFCIAHPHVCAILGVCIDTSASTVGIHGHNGLTIDTGDNPCELWLVEEAFSQESLQQRLERGLLSWQQMLQISRDMGRLLAYMQNLRKLQPSSGGASFGGNGVTDMDIDGAVGCNGGYQPALTPQSLACMVMPAHIVLNAHTSKLSLVPALLTHLTATLGLPSPLSDASSSPLPYINPSVLVTACADSSITAAHTAFGFGVMLLQLLTEQPPMGLLGAVRESLAATTLMHLVPRMPGGDECVQLAEDFARLAVRCTADLSSGGRHCLEVDVVPALEAMSERLEKMGTAVMSWEQMEELMMMPLSPAAIASDLQARRWVRQDFRARRKLFLEEVAKLAMEGPIHKIEVRRSRCFKDSVTTFSGKGQAVWRQPLKVTFVGEAGMDSGGVTREWFSSISSALSRGSLDLFWHVGNQQQQLYINPLSNSPSHLKRFQFVGMFMAKALLETAARGKELGPITLNLQLCEPFWKLLLGIPLSLLDMQLLDMTEFRSLMQLLEIDIDGLIFETFTWNFQHQQRAVKSDEPEVPSLPSTSSPFAPELKTTVSSELPLKPGGAHMKVTNTNKREYVLLKAHRMLLGAVETQMSTLIDSFHSLIPRDLIDKYGFTSLEMQLLICGEQRIDLADLRAHTKYEDGYTGKEVQIEWFWQAVDTFNESERRALLQFWSGSDGMPADGFGSLEPGFHMIAVERMYDGADKTARLPAAHTCFRQLDLPRYISLEETREKILTAITMGQGYMALS